MRKRMHTMSHKYHIGDKIYFAGYDEVFPEESQVSEYEVLDVSEKGMLLTTASENYWIDSNDPEERMYPTREEAEAALKRIIKEDKK